MAVKNPTILRQVLRDETQKVFKQAGAKVAVVGLSGGVNSALALAVAADAVGKENMAALYIGAHSNPKSLECAQLAAKSQGIELIELDVSNDVDSLWAQFRDRTKAWEPALDNPKGLRIENRISGELFQAAIVARGSIRSCIRSTILDSYGKAFAINRAVARGDQNYYGVLIMGTGDEGEDRFFRARRRQRRRESPQQPCEERAPAGGGPLLRHPARSRLPAFGARSPARRSPSGAGQAHRGRGDVALFRCAPHLRRDRPQDRQLRELRDTGVGRARR